MSTTIKDRLSGNLARVDSSGRVHTFSTVETEHHHQTDEGDSYNLNTGVITLSSGDESAVMYFKNNEVQDFYIRAVAIGLSPTTGGDATETNKITLIRNPTTGTIVDNATNVDINSNRNFNSSKSLSNSLVYKGAEANTLTDGDDHIIFFQTAGTRLYAEIGEIMSKGNSIGVKIDPQASNTNMLCYVAIIGHLEETEVT